MEEKLEIRDARGGKWGWFPKEIIADSRLSSSGKLAYMSLALFANTVQKCWPARHLLAQVCGISERSLTSGIQELEKCGYIHVHREKGRSNKYVLLSPPVGSANFAVVQNMGVGSANKHRVVVQNSTTNNNKEQELNNNTFNLSTDGEKPVENLKPAPAVIKAMDEARKVAGLRSRRTR